MAGRLFVSRDTLWRLERGDPTVSAGTLATTRFGFFMVRHVEGMNDYRSFESHRDSSFAMAFRRSSAQASQCPAFGDSLQVS